MAGRPRTMAKRVAQLYEAYAAIAKELERLMPQQYHQATKDPLGRTWQTAVQALEGIDDFFMDLVSELDYKAEKVEKRAAVAATTAIGDPASSPSVAPDNPS